MMESQPDHPYFEVVEEARKLHAQGMTVFQKFTCTGCGTRLTVSQPNTFLVEAICCRCGTVTNIETRGCGYMVEMSRRAG